MATWESKVEEAMSGFKSLSNQEMDPTVETVNEMLIQLRKISEWVKKQGQLSATDRLYYLKRFDECYQVFLDYARWVEEHSAEQGAQKKRKRKKAKRKARKSRKTRRLTKYRRKKHTTKKKRKTKRLMKYNN